MPILKIWDEQQQAYVEIPAIKGASGPQGPAGADGAQGPAATINGVNALTINGGNNITATQQGSTLTLDTPNALQVAGGGSLEIDAAIGSGPYEITVTEEEENVTAAQIAFANTSTGMSASNVQAAIDELFTDVSEGKALIAAAVTGKGVQTAADDTFQTMANNIGAIETGGSSEQIIQEVSREEFFDSDLVVPVAIEIVWSTLAVDIDSIVGSSSNPKGDLAKTVFPIFLGYKNTNENPYYLPMWMPNEVMGEYLDYDFDGSSFEIIDTERNYICFFDKYTADFDSLSIYEIHFYGLYK